MKLDDTMTFSIDKEREEYHQRKKRRKIIRLLIALIIWAILIIYLLTPFATYKLMHVKGNVYLSEDEVIELGGIKHTWWFLVDSNKLRSKLESYSNIENVSTSFGFKGLNISIVEKYPLATRNDKYLMNTSFNLVDKSEYPLEIDNLIDISKLEEKDISTFANQYIHVDLDIRETFYDCEMEAENVLILYGKFDEFSYFKMKVNLLYLSSQLSSTNFNKFKDKMLGKMANDNVKYSVDNPYFDE